MAPTRVWTSHGTLIAASFYDMRGWEEESGRPDVVINLSTRSVGAAVQPVKGIYPHHLKPATLFCQ